MSGPRLRLLLAGLTLVLAACGTSVALRHASTTIAGSNGGRFEAILINGGGRRASNYQSHLLHVKKLYALLRQAGVRRDDIAIFSADGSDPEADLAVRAVQSEGDFWLLRGTRLEPRLRPQLRFENSAVADAKLEPATKNALRAWFEGAARRLRAGDTLLLYVTDHGTKNRDDTSNNRITLWGKNESIPVDELRGLLELLDPGVRVVTLMSQCYSGAFANLMYAGTTDGAPRGNICGFFSSTPERPAYGCYPENRDKDNVGHSFRFLEALRSDPQFTVAHQRVLVSDRTPDVPLKTSDIYLANLLDAAASKKPDRRHEGDAEVDAKVDAKVHALVDRLLRKAWRNKAAWEPEIRLLDRIGQAFGYFSPRSLAELNAQATLLPDVSEKFNLYGRAWRAALNSLAGANLERFVGASSSWEDRLSTPAVASLDTDGRRALTQALLRDLGDYTRADTATSARLDLLKEKAEATKAARYRMQVRLGVVLRMEAILRSVAGRVYLAYDATEDEREAYGRLIDCETFSLPGTRGASPPPVVPAPFPSYEEELELADAALPGWMGIRFRQASEKRREKYDLQQGAVSVVTVYPDSPAKKAGLEVGDVILGPPAAPFTESHQIREWVMTAEIGTPQPLLVNRGGEELDLTLTPQPYPIKWPELPGPPKIGSTAPALEKLDPYRGDVPVELAGGASHLLFFWATWCAPCKASLPEVVAFERERNTQVIAITDELAEQLDKFFAQHEGPFPETVALDEFRRSFLAYGVSGTPSFVLVDGTGKVKSRSTGYEPKRGLGIEGWSWKDRPAPAKSPQGRSQVHEP